MKKICSKNLMSQSGQSVMEYIILASLIGIFCLAAVRKIGGTMKKKLTTIESQMNTIKFR
jgi:Flp pilus assembly pilin Flp